MQCERSTLGDHVCTLKKGESIKIKASMGRFKITFSDELQNEFQQLKHLDNWGAFSQNLTSTKSKIFSRSIFLITPERNKNVLVEYDISEKKCNMCRIW